VTAALIYRKKKDKKHALAGCIAATAVMSGVAVLVNKYLLIPFFSKIMPLEAIVAACGAVNPAINSIDAYYIFGVIPFNLVKGVILSAATMLCYKKLSVFIKQKWD
jgi:riboflavin transporter FmnP